MADSTTTNDLLGNGYRIHIVEAVVTCKHALLVLANIHANERGQPVPALCRYPAKVAGKGVTPGAC